MHHGTARMVLVGFVVITTITGAAFAGPFGEVSHTETFQALGSTPAYQAFLGPPRTAIFTNLAGQDVVGLKLIFSSAVPSLRGYGVAAEATLISNAGLTAVFEGTIPNYGGVYAEWDEPDAKVLIAEWLRADGSSISIDLHQPFARMTGTATYDLSISVGSVPLNGAPLAPMNGYFATPLLDATFKLDGSLSSTFDGTEIVRYQWEWNDGLIQEGPKVERTLSMTLEIEPFIGQTTYEVATVTLTVWSVGGSTSSVGKTFTLRVVLELN